MCGEEIYIMIYIVQEISVTYLINPRTGAPAPPAPAAGRRPRSFRDGQAIVRTGKAVRDRRRRRVLAPPSPANPAAAVPPARADRAAPHGGSNGSKGSAR